MKVLYILHILEMHGSNISLFNTIKGLKRKGVVPVLVLPSGQSSDDSFYRELNKLEVKCYWGPIFGSIINRDLYYAWSLKQKIHFLLSLYKRKYHSYQFLSKVVKKEKPSIIHTNVGIIHEGFWVAKRYKIPHVFHIREYQDKDFGWKIVPSKKKYIWMLKHSNVISITDALRKHFGLLKYSKAYTIYNGVYPKQNTSLSLPKENFFFCACRICKEKGFDDVILSFAKFFKSHPNFNLILAGSGDKSYIDKIKALAKQNNCNENVVFLGAIDNVYDYMRNAYALIVGSYNEGFGRMTAEAAFAGCIVIGRNTGGTKEILDKIGGYRFETFEDLITSMSNVVDLPDNIYWEKARYAQDQATKWFSTEQNVEQISNLYQEIIKKC